MEHKKSVLIYSLATIAFSIMGVISALTADGRWYYVVSAIVLLAGGATFAARAILASRDGDADGSTKPGAART